MNRTLYLLVTSERPDSYLNSVVHCLLKEGIRTVEFIYIHGFDEHQPNRIQPQGKKSAYVMHLVVSLLRSLADEGEYTDAEYQPRKLDLRTVYPSEHFAVMQATYRQCAQMEVQWNHRDIFYRDLRKEIRLMSTREPTPIVDVSAIRKLYIGDLVAASVVEDIDSLYTFDLVCKPNFKEPWTMLYHDLQEITQTGPKYRYINLLDTPVFKECSRSILVKKPSLAISLGIGLLILVGTSLAHLYFGASNWFVQLVFILSSTAGILSFFYNIFPLRN